MLYMLYFLNLFSYDRKSCTTGHIYYTSGSPFIDPSWDSGGRIDPELE